MADGEDERVAEFGQRFEERLFAVSECVCADFEKVDGFALECEGGFEVGWGLDDADAVYLG